MRNAECGMRRAYWAEPFAAKRLWSAAMHRRFGIPRSGQAPADTYQEE